MIETGRHSWLSVAGAAWLGAAAVYLATEWIAAAAFPGYSLAADFISDLGIPYPSVDGGRAIASPLAAVFNAGLIVQAALLVIAATAFGIGLGRRPAGYRVMLAASLADAAGLLLVALVHSGNREAAEGTIAWHMLGAGLSTVGGNATALAAGLSARRLGLPAGYGRLATALGIIGLVALAALLSRFAPLPPGLLERASVYPITIWQIATGLVLLRTGRAGAVRN